MRRHNLTIAYLLKDEIKQKHPIKFDGEARTWYINCQGNLPDDLVKYAETFVDVKYEEREEYKLKFDSLQWDKHAKSWKCSAEDADNIESYRARCI